MAEKLEIYKCSICGILTEVLAAGGGKLVCCGKPMDLQAENTVDASREKHVPVIERNAAGITVKVGSVPHPMEEKHYIAWIEVVAGDQIFRRHLAPGEAPEATFPVTATDITVREYCTLHGQWAAQG